MSTQKRKFELFTRLQNLGFTYEEACQLRRIEMTLQRWAEMECGDGNDFASWSIERDETTGVPYRCTYPHNGPMRRHRVADREKGAMRRLKAIVSARNARAYVNGQCVNVATFYHQSDPRGCALYIVTASDMPRESLAAWVDAHPGANQSCYDFAGLDSLYTRGLAVCA